MGKHTFTFWNQLFVNQYKLLVINQYEFIQCNVNVSLSSFNQEVLHDLFQI